MQKVLFKMFLQFTRDQTYTMFLFLNILLVWGIAITKDGAVVRALSFYSLSVSRVRFPDPALYPGVEFVVGFPLCCECFFTGFSGFPLSSKTNIFKF